MINKKIDNKKNIKLLSPKIDIVFQVLFGETGNEEITRDFLKEILKEDIISVDLSKNPILRRMTPNDKMGVLDVIAKINNNVLCNIEMQLSSQKDIFQRLLFYWARTYSKTIRKSDKYSTLHRTIVILISGTKIDSLENLDYFSKWKLIETKERKIILTDHMEIDIIELPKIYESVRNNNDKLLDWLYFLENPESEEVKRIMENNSGIKKAAEKLEEISSDEVLQRLAEWKEAGEHQEASMLAQAKEEGSQEEKRNIAKNMKKENIDISVIIKVTGLTREEIETLS